MIIILQQDRGTVPLSYEKLKTPYLQGFRLSPILRLNLGTGAERGTVPLLCCHKFSKKI